MELSDTYAVPSVRVEDVSSGLPKVAKVAVKLPARDGGFVSPLDARKYVHWDPMTYHPVFDVVDNVVYQCEPTVEYCFKLDFCRDLPGRFVSVSAHKYRFARNRRGRAGCSSIKGGRRRP